jgi:RimJ/RimL family protein N-acetyltransferase
LGDTSIRGAGIGSKVEYNVLQYVFETLKLNKLNCTVFPFNESVIKMHEGFGFRREAYFRQHVLKDGVYYDVVGLALLKSEWITLKEFMFNKIYKR